MSEIGGITPYVRPEPPEEWVLLMQQYWAELLEVERSTIGPESDLFALGADSFDLLYLQTRIEARFEITLPEHALIEAPTPWEMAQMIAENEPAHEPLSRPPAGKALLEVSAGPEDLPPLIVIPGGDGRFLIDTAWLSRLLVPRRRVIGVTNELDLPMQPQWIERQVSVWETEILEAVPSGPYLIFGICLGASLGWEIARRLHRHGSTHLLVMDPVRPTTEATGKYYPRWLGARAYTIPASDVPVTALVSPGHEDRERRVAMFDRASVPLQQVLLSDRVTTHGMIGGPMRYVAPEVQRWIDRVTGGETVGT